jgi:hypothetical protein
MDSRGDREYERSRSLVPILVRGEDSRHPFKRDETNADSVTAELPLCLARIQAMKRVKT